MFLLIKVFLFSSRYHNNSSPSMMLEAYFCSIENRVVFYQICAKLHCIIALFPLSASQNLQHMMLLGILIISLLAY